MYDSTAIAHQARCLRSMLFTHTLADLGQCPHTSNGMTARFAAISGQRPTGDANHKWLSRLNGATMHCRERESYLALYPSLVDVWNDPLWQVLGDEFGSAESWDVQFTLHNGSRAVGRSFHNADMVRWCGVPGADGVARVTLLLRTSDPSLYSQRMWMAKNFTLYLALACIEKPLSVISEPLYAQLEALRDAGAFQATQKMLLCDACTFKCFVVLKREQAHAWQADRRGRTDAQARHWLWQLPVDPRPRLPPSTGVPRT